MYLRGEREIIFGVFKEKYDLTKERSENAISKLKYQNDLKVLQQKLAAFSLRETKETAKLNLPNKVFERVEVNMDQEQRNIYEKVRKELSIEIIKDGKLEIEEFNFIAVRLMRLIQISSLPSIYDECYKNKAPKLKALEQIIERIPQDEKVIIWANYIKSSEILFNEFQSKGAVLLNGDIDIDQRNHAIERFKKDKKIKFMIATYGTAKEGLTLTVANHSIFFERNFSLADYLQAQDRIHRISQNKISYIYNIYTKDSAEDWLEALVLAKESAAAFVQGDITEDEFTKKIRYDYSEILENILN